MRAIHWFTSAVILAALSAGQVGFAQFSVETAVANMYDDNVNNNYQQSKSNVSTLSLTTGYGWRNEVSTLKLFYDGAYNYFQAIPERTNHGHSANMLYAHAFGEDSERILNLGSAYGFTVNRDGYSSLNYSALAAFTNYKYYVDDAFINKLGYAFKVVTFPTLKEFSYSEHAIFLHGAFAATSTTTAILQADLGAKYYATAATEQNSLTGSKSPSSFRPDVTQLSGTFRVGQSIAEGTGLSLTTKYQWNLLTGSRYLSEDYGYVSDDEVLDDHYGYEGLNSSLMLTQILSESMMMKVTVGLQNKLYSSLAAYNLAGDMTADTRRDTRSYMNIFFQKDIQAIGVSIKAAVDIIRNNSNDSYYDYRNSAYTIEFSVPF